MSESKPTEYAINSQKGTPRGLGDLIPGYQPPSTMNPTYSLPQPTRDPALVRLALQIAKDERAVMQEFREIFAPEVSGRFPASKFRLHPYVVDGALEEDLFQQLDFWREVSRINPAAPADRYTLPTALFDYPKIPADKVDAYAEALQAVRENGDMEVCVASALRESNAPGRAVEQCHDATQRKILDAVFPKTQEAGHAK